MFYWGQPDAKTTQAKTGCVCFGCVICVMYTWKFLHVPSHCKEKTWQNFSLGFKSTIEKIVLREALQIYKWILNLATFVRAPHYLPKQLNPATVKNMAWRNRYIE